jgi:hypothetical protein
MPPEPTRAPRPAAKTAKAKAAPKPAADRRGLDAAERKLRQLLERRGKQEDLFRARREALDAEEAEARRSFEAARAKAQRRIDAENAAYRNAGGEG